MAEFNLTQALGCFGLEHEANDGHRRHVMWRRQSLGLMDVQEGWHPFALLKEVSQAGIRVSDLYDAADIVEHENHEIARSLRSMAAFVPSAGTT
jgi:hypothetical protein